MLCRPCIRVVSFENIPLPCVVTLRDSLWVVSVDLKVPTLQARPDVNIDGRHLFVTEEAYYVFTHCIYLLFRYNTLCSTRVLVQTGAPDTVRFIYMLAPSESILIPFLPLTHITMLLTQHEGAPCLQIVFSRT